MIDAQVSDIISKLEYSEEDVQAVKADKVSGFNDDKTNREEVINKLKELINESVEEVRDEVDLLKQNYYKLRKAEIDECKKKFLEQGGDESDFIVQPDELEETLKDLMNVFKEKKSALLEEQERTRNENLQAKIAILDELKNLIDDADNISKHYTEFQNLQQRFRTITDIPQKNVNELWKNFQLYVEKFYDLLKINKELRDYDFKKNYEAKLGICVAAEALSTEPDVVVAFRKLQKYHEEWREIGPVAKELKDELWTRFKNASTAINKLHQSHFDKLKEEETKNEEAKIEICAKIEQIDYATLNSFNAWEAKTKEIIAFQEQWKKLGFAARKINNTLFERFRNACDDFFKRKAEYFKAVKDELNENLEKKKALCEKAELLKDSVEWRSTTDILIAIQKEWKTIGPVPKKYSDAVWKRFIDACDYFFVKKEKNVSSQKVLEQDNLKIKTDVIEGLRKIDKDLDQVEAIKQVRELISVWNQTGHVPFSQKDKIYKEYQELLDKHFTHLNMNESKSKLVNFTSNINQISRDDKSQGKLYHERERLLRSYEHIKNEVKTYENNIGFLSSSSKNGSGIVKEMNRKIVKLKEEMDLIAKKIDVIDENL